MIDLETAFIAIGIFTACILYEEIQWRRKRRRSVYREGSGV